MVLKTGGEYADPAYVYSTHIKRDGCVSYSEVKLCFEESWCSSRVDLEELIDALDEGLEWVHDISTSEWDGFNAVELRAYSKSENKELGSFEQLFHSLRDFVVDRANRDPRDGWEASSAFEKAWRLYAKEVHKLGLCQGRHEIPGLDGYIFGEIADPTDVQGLYDRAKNKIDDLQVEKLDLYVTGLTVALGAVIKACMHWGIPLTLYHFDRETGEYYPQDILD